jgi:hypothetical protein
VFGSMQMDEVADPIILAWQLGATSSTDVESLANYLVANGPYTPEERWEENSGYSPATMAAEIACMGCMRTCQVPLFRPAGRARELHWPYAEFIKVKDS